jgi:HK97 family phage major capsid protein
MNKSFRFLIMAAVLGVLAVCAFDAAAAQHAIGFLTSHPEAALLANAPLALPAAVKAELERIHGDLATPLHELLARVQSVEQIVASGAQAGGLSAGAGPTLGVSAHAKFVEDPAFQAAASAAQRGMKPSQFAARINLDGSIQAALISDGGTATSGNTYPVPPDRSTGIVGPVQRPLRLLDVMPSRPTSSDAVEYVQLDVSGDVSEQDAQGDTKAELDFEGTLQRSEIATIAGWTSASKQVLADAQGLQQAIDQVIRNKLLSRLENQLINGTGDPGKIKGLLAHAITFIPSIGTTPADVIGESLVRQADNGYQPGLILLNPLDWFRIQITKSATEEEYIFGSPTMPVPRALWNTPVVVTPSIAEGSGMTLDKSFTTVLDREQMTVQVSNQHSDFFIRNLVAILGELRAGLEVRDRWAVYKFDLPAASSGP